MGYVRKTEDVYEIITDYGYGEEVEASYASAAEMRADYKIYLEERRNGYLPNLISIRARKRRVRKEIA